MRAFLPSMFIVLSVGGLLFAVSFIWASLRSLFGGVSESHVGESQAMRSRHELLDEKEAVLKSIKDLDFEHEVGKLSDEDYQKLAAETRARAKVILKQLDDDVREHRVKAEKLLEKELGRALKQDPKPELST
ncbi:MAG: hypothetical protein JWN04_2132 [Myxococcaceae bacterium]|nr:hypothetical protein [Myxococcaceae bacterium]